MKLFCVSFLLLGSLAYGQDDFAALIIGGYSVGSSVPRSNSTELFGCSGDQSINVADFPTVI